MDERICFTIFFMLSSIEALGAHMRQWTVSGLVHVVVSHVFGYKFPRESDQN